MRNLGFILFVLINLGLIQSFRCIQNITNEHIVQKIDHDEFTSASAHQLDDDNDHRIPSQKKKRKRIRITDQNFDLQSLAVLIYFHTIKIENSHLPFSSYASKEIYRVHKRGPPVSFS